MFTTRTNGWRLTERRYFFEMSSLNRTFSRFCKNGDLWRYQADFHQLTKTGKLKVAELLDAGVKPEEAMAIAAVTLSDTEWNDRRDVMAGKKVGTVITIGGRRVERVDGRKRNGLFNIYSEAVDLF